MEDIRFGDLKRHEYFSHEGNTSWIKATWNERIHEPHNAYRTDYGATPKGQLAVWWKQFNDDETVQTKEY